MNISQDEVNVVIEKEQKELDRRNEVYRDDRPFPAIKNKTIILVDDGIATGATIKAGITALKQLEPASLVVAVPVAEKEMCEKIEALVDRLICPLRPVNFYAVGAWYEDFSQTEDEEVFSLLNDANVNFQ